jgi:hypothetical protein
MGTNNNAYTVRCQAATFDLLDTLRSLARKYVVETSTGCVFGRKVECLKDGQVVESYVLVDAGSTLANDTIVGDAVISCSQNELKSSRSKLQGPSRSSSS